MLILKPELTIIAGAHEGERRKPLPSQIIPQTCVKNAGDYGYPSLEPRPSSPRFYLAVMEKSPQYFSMAALPGRVNNAQYSLLTFAMVGPSFSVEFHVVHSLFTAMPGDSF